MRMYMQNPPLIRIGGQNTRALYQYTLQSQDRTLFTGPRPIWKRS